MFIFCAFVALPEIFSEKATTDSDPVEIQMEWEEVLFHPNRLPTYIWVIKVSEGRERVENIISFDDFNEKFDNDELVRVTYVVERNRVVFYGDEEISPTNIKLWRAVAIPQQKTNGGSVLFSEPTTSENGIIYKEFSTEIAFMKIIFAVITGFLFVMIPYMFYNIRGIYNKDYKNEETRS